MEERYDKNLANHLLGRIKSNKDDKDSVIAFYNLMYKPAYHIALNYLNRLRPSWQQNFSDAEDIAGDAFVVVLNTVGKLLFIKNAAGWIFKITERLAKRFVSKRKNERVLEPDMADSKADLSLENKVSAADILSRLKPRELKIVLYHYYFGYTYSEISVILKISQSTIKQTMAEIKKRNQIDDELKEPQK